MREAAVTACWLYRNARKKPDSLKQQSRARSFAAAFTPASSRSLNSAGYQTRDDRCDAKDYEVRVVATGQLRTATETTLDPSECSLHGSAPQMYVLYYRLLSSGTK